jgi:cytochrome b subunit of formate dehydrogenase
MFATLAAALFLTLAPSAGDDECLACHGQKEMKSESGRSISVDAANLKASVHDGLGCTTCHAGVKEYPHPKPMPRVSCATCHAEPKAEIAKSAHEVLGPQACGRCHGAAHETQGAAKASPQQCNACHGEIVRDFQSSVHAAARKNGASDSPSCQTCHGPTHRILPSSDPASPVAKKSLADTCAACHANPAFQARHKIPISRPVEQYKLSVHGRAVAAGRTSAAACSDCHGSHGIFPARDARSKINHWNVPATCGQCHAEIAKIYLESIHGQAMRASVRDAPVCTDCHGEHLILAHLESNSLVNTSRVSTDTCGRCHSNERLAERYNLPTDRLPSYADSYHGLAMREGSQTVANCASCHGVHNIFPSSDPRSTIHAANLPRTCGRCHTGAGENFAIGPVHVQISSGPAHPVVKWIRWIYLVLIPLTLGFMVLHNLVDLLAKLVRRRPRHDGKEHAVRMNYWFRIAHWGVMISFPALVFTGFALKYPERWWARPLVLWESHVAFRGTVHRIAAVVLIAATAYHILHLAVNKRDRVFLAAMLPRWKDFRDLVQVFLYNLGLTAEEPKFAKFNYAEKVEYWAFLWGTAVMTLSGFLLWFNNFTLRHFPKWVADAATAIHFYEALLATFSILLWHFYMVIFDPIVYPMDLSWLTGKVPADHYRHTRPEYYRALEQAGLVRDTSAGADSTEKDIEPREIKNPPEQG